MPITINGNGTVSGITSTVLNDDTASKLYADSVAKLNYSSPNPIDATGTAVDVTGIPAGINELDLILFGVSTTGTSSLILQIGDGAIVTTGYRSNAQSAGASEFNANAVGFYLLDITTAATLAGGIVNLRRLAPNSNVWILGGSTSRLENTNASSLAGYVTLTGSLDRLRLTTVGGTQTFDAGSFNVVWR